jgi:hypothetical protein
VVDDARHAGAARTFEAYARASSPDMAELMRRCAGDPAILDLVPERPGWDAPHRLSAAVDWLVDVGSVADFRAQPDPWAAFREAALDHAEWVREFVRTQPVQTNEVQRCFALLPIFLSVARKTGRPLDLVELGASAGLNLLWDRYRYRYVQGCWGPESAGLELAGDERGTVPAEVLRQEVEIRGRRGIDLNPLDLGVDDDVRILRVFAAPHRRPRLLRAIEVARHEPPEVMRGDYLELLPDLLADRDPDALTVVFQTLSSVYLSDDGRARLWEIVDTAGRGGSLAYIWTPTPEEHGQRRDDYPIELAMWRGPERRFIARMENHGEWLDWVGITHDG